MFKGKALVMPVIAISFLCSTSFAGIQGLVADTSKPFHVIDGKPLRDPYDLVGGVGFMIFGKMTAQGAKTSIQATGSCLFGAYDLWKTLPGSTVAQGIYKTRRVGSFLGTGALFGGLTLASAGLSVASFTIGSVGLIEYAAGRGPLKVIGKK